MSGFEFLIYLYVQVRIVLEQLDSFKNLVGSVYYDDGGEVKNLALELVKNVSISGSKACNFYFLLHKVHLLCSFLFRVSITFGVGAFAFLMQHAC